MNPQIDHSAHMVWGVFLVLWERAKGNPDYKRAQWVALERYIDNLVKDSANVRE